MSGAVSRLTDAERAAVIRFAEKLASERPRGKVEYVDAVRRKFGIGLTLAYRILKDAKI